MIIKQTKNNILYMEGSNLFVKVLDRYKKIKKVNGLPLVWHFPNTELGNKLANEQFEHICNRDYKVYRTIYHKEIEELAEKYYNIGS